MVIFEESLHHAQEMEVRLLSWLEIISAFLVVFSWMWLYWVSIKFYSIKEAARVCLYLIQSEYVHTCTHTPVATKNTTTT